MRYKDNDLLNNILSYINEKRLEENYCPTMQEIATKFGVTKGTVCNYMAELEARGLLERKKENGRFNVSTAQTNKTLASILNIPVVGEIACGTPILAEENIDNYVYISRDFLGEGNFFALRAKGDSMIEANIFDGDTVIVRQQDSAEEGQIVVALINDEATLKRYYFDKAKKQIRLHPENSTMSDMFFDKVNIQGIVKKVIKDVE